MTQVQRQFRTMRGACESKDGKEMSPKSNAMPWLVRHAASTLFRELKGKDGFTAYRRIKGKEFSKELVEFGECVWYLKPKCKGKNKAKDRWDNGVWLEAETNPTSTSWARSEE